MLEEIKPGIDSLALLGLRKMHSAENGGAR